VEAPQPGTRGARALVAGIGDDAAVWQPSRSHLSVITTDALVEGVHFTEAMDPAAVGHRAMAANLSDIAAMGARPVLATVALGVAPWTTEAWILACYRAMAALAARHGTRIAGGDIVRSPVVSLALTVVGEVSRTRLKRRGGGRPGDVLAVTGPLGASRAGLELLRRELPLDEAMRRAAKAAFALPSPRVREGRWLAASAGVHALMDSSDGLVIDAGRLAAACGCGGSLDNVPIAAAAQAVAGAAGHSALAYALGGGEDFELIAAIEPRAFSHMAARFAAHFGKPLLAVGHLEPEPGLRLGPALGPEPPPAGWDHLAGREVSAAR
jgi:thiamine-monophosphate kinase